MSEENTQTQDPQTTQPIIPGLEAAVKKPRKPKAATKTYYVTDCLSTEDRHGNPYNHFHVVNGSGGGFRSKEEMNKFIRNLSPGTYVPVVVSNRPIVVEVKSRVSIKGI